jgi:hypothetical protein
MRRKRTLLIFAGFLAVSFSPLAFAQEQLSQQPASSPEASAPAKPVMAEWLYGEVNSVDIAGKSVTLSYLDYDTDIEKQAVVYTDSKTVFENAKSIEEIKPQDMVSIDYIIGPDKKNVAVNISVEKPESMGDLEMGGAVPPEPKQQMKPAVENISVPAAAEPIPDSEEN